MPRNTFKAGDEQEPEDDGEYDLDIGRDEDGLPFIRKIPRTPAGKPEDEASDLEVDPVVDDPHMWPGATLAELRKMGGGVTRAHQQDLPHQRD